MQKKIPDKWLYVPIALLGVYFVIRLIDQSKLIYIFPLDQSSDIASYIASLFFLAKCGFNKFCPYWYNGFISFHTFSPGWQFFTYPFYMISKNILLSTYLSIISIYALSFVFIFLLGRNEKWSVTKRIAFFLFFFANAVNIGNFFKLGRVVELFGWCMFLGVAVIILYYKSNKLDKKFLLFIPVFGFSILSHPQETILTSILIIPLLLIKRNAYERLIIVLATVFSILLTSFWWVPFILKGSTVMFQSTHQGAWLWGIWGLTSLVAFLISLTFFVIFYYYWLSKNKSVEELLFFSPVLILNALFLLRLTPIIPILGNISPDPYIVFFLFFTTYLLFNLDINVLNKTIKNFMPVVLGIIVLFSLSISHFKTPYFVEHTVNEAAIKSMFPYVDDRFLLLNNRPLSYSGKEPPPFSVAYYSYAPIFFNLSTVGGFYPHIMSEEYNNKYQQLFRLKHNWDCKTFRETIPFFNTTNIIAYGDVCENLESCGLRKIKDNDGACLYKLDNTQN